MPHRPRFDPKRPLIAARAFLFAGRNYALGDPFPHPDDGQFDNRLLARQYEARAVNMGEAPEEAPELITMTKAAKNGYFDINAPWFEKPLTIRGKVNAEKALAEVREEGAPLGWIEGGTETEVEEVGGGWYAISAPWLDEPEKIQGREAAEARQREIHDAGAPTPVGGEATAETDGGIPVDGEAESGVLAGDQQGDTPAENLVKSESDDAATGEGDLEPSSDTADTKKEAEGGAGAASDEPGEAGAGKSDDDPATA